MSAANTIGNPPPVSEARRLLLERLRKGDPVVRPIPVSPRGGRMPLSFAQSRLWFIDQYLPQSPLYNMFTALRIRAEVTEDDRRHLEQSLCGLVERHEVLRTRLVSEGGEVWQQIEAAMAVPLEYEDLSGYAAWERAGAVQERASAEASRPFDLSTGPLLRARLLRVAEGEHILFLTMHHIVSDGWSVGILVREMAELFQAAQQGRAPRLQPLPIQYADFARWQREVLQGERLEGLLGYWKRQLDGVPVLELPTSRRRPAVQNHQGARHLFRLDRQVKEALEALSRQANATLFMTLLAAFQTLLYRYSGQADIAVGSPIANRTRRETEGLIGFFVNTLVLRGDLTGNPTFAELLARTRQLCLDAYAHQELPFEKLVDELKPQRFLSHSPLFQVMFVLQNAKGAELANSEFSEIPFDSKTSKVDLLAVAVEDDEGIQMTFEYDSDLFQAAEVARMADRFAQTLSCFIADPKERIGDFRMVTDEELSRLAPSIVAEGKAVFGTIQERFEEQARLSPSAVALVGNDTVLTYAELNERANQLAHALRGAGVEPEQFVGICIDRTIEMVVSILGILKAGGAYVPLDISYPRERLQFMMDDSALAFAVTTEASRKHLPETRARIVCLDRDADLILSQPKDNPLPVTGAGHLAYLIYTSGSTGTPKGAMVEQGNVLRLFDQTEDWFHFDSRDCWTLFHSCAFDFSVWELWGALMHGGRLIVVPYGISRSPDEFYELLVREKVTVLNQTPSAFRQLMRAEENRPAAPQELSLRTIIFGGESLSLASLRPWFERHGDKQPRLINMYGITETTVHVTYRPVTIEDLDLPANSPIGVPIPDLQLHILDSRGELAPVGIPGEIYVGGQGVARGYLHRKGLTAERFVADGISGIPGARLYRSGDLGRREEDGSIDYLGRIDDQVKVRGFRIELGEIEAALRKCPGVSDCTVMVREDEPGDQRLAAYIVRKNSGDDPARTGAGSSTVHQWKSVFDETYRQPSAQSDKSFNVIGWNDSYSGQAISATAMAEWLDSTVDSIASLHPESVLEIGCGTGMILSRLAPHCRYYSAWDLSPAAIEYVSGLVKQNDWKHVELRASAADEIENLPAGRFDTVVINSVIQYFPDIEYLVQVLSRIIDSIAPGGRIFLGDLRNAELSRVFQTSIATFKAAADATAEALRQIISRAESLEAELLIDPRFMLAIAENLPRMRYATIRLKRGSDRNEMTGYRYDAVLHLDRVPPSCDARQLQWGGQLASAEDLEAMLVAAPRQAMVIRGIPNARIAASVAQERAIFSGAAPTLTEIRAADGDAEAIAADPEELCRLCEKRGLYAEPRWSSEGAAVFDLVIASHPDAALRVAFLDPNAFNLDHWKRYASDPLRSRLDKLLIERVKDDLKARLPSYMRPASYVMLNELPLTENGKTDRRKLPAPIKSRENRRDLLPGSISATEAAVMTIWQEFFPDEAIDLDVNFFDLGGHSLLTTQLVFRMQEAFAIKVPLSAIFENPTIRELARCVEEGARQSFRPLDITQDVGLPPAVQVQGGQAQPFSEGNVLLTGAAGFLGSFLLHYLLENTNARVTCLVRANSEAHARERVLAPLQKNTGAAIIDPARIAVVCGDLALPGLGLSGETFGRLANEVDAIFHCGALVNFSLPYERVKQANVDGTNAILTLAAGGKAKHLHYVSTVGVFSPSDFGSGATIYESDEPKDWRSFSLAYSQSKWVAEKNVFLAAKAGLPCSIYRPGRISGHSRTGVCQEADFFWRIVQASVTVGSLPDLPIPVDLSPVDYVAEAIVHLAMTQPQAGKAYHLVNPHTLTLAEFGVLLQEIGYPVRLLPFDEWLCEVERHSLESGNAAYELLPLLTKGTADNEMIPDQRFDCSETLKGLEGSAIVCPVLDAGLLARYADYFSASGFFPATQTAMTGD